MPRSATARPLPSVLAAAIGAAGFAFLVLEVAWQRSLALALGATVTASAVVLAAFMAGWGLGAALWGPRADRAARPERLFAALLGGTALVVPALSWFFRAVLPGLGWPEPAVLALAALLLTAAAVPMGGAFPSLSRALARRLPAEASLGAALGGLYAVETLGSALGGLAAGFVLLGGLGQRGTEAAAAAAALVAALLALAAPAPAGEEPAPAAAPKRRRAPAASPGPARLAAFLCGLTVLGLQVLWLRMVKVVLTNTSYLFALTASLAVAGLFLGGALYARRAARVRDPGRELTLALGWLILLAAGGTALAARLPQTLLFPLEGLFATPVARAFLLPALAAVLVVLPASAASGYAFPLACRMAAGDRRHVGAAVGGVLLANTAGSVTGPLLATFVLLPALGAAVSAAALLAVAAIGALAVSRSVARTPAGVRPALGAAATAGLALLLLQPTVRILPPSFLKFGREVLFYRESVNGTLSVGVDPGTRSQALYTFVDNSAVIGSSYDAIKAVKLVGHLPFLLGLEARDVLVVGFGIGVTTSAVAAHEGVERLDCVELAPGLRDAAVFYRDLNRDVARDRRLNLFAGDGRRHLARGGRAYDLITCDPTHPVLGSGALYTRDWFELCRERLAPGGMVSQYLPLHKLRPEDFRGLLRTFAEVFPHGAVWLGHYHAVLVGGLDPLDTEWDDWRARVEDLGQDPHFYVDPYHLAASLALAPAQLASLTADARINTDDRSYTEFFRPASLDEGNLTANLRWFREHPPALDGIFHGVGDPETMDRYRRGNDLLLGALNAMLDKDLDASRRLLEEAAAANPENGEYPFLLRLYY